MKFIFLLLFIQTLHAQKPIVNEYALIDKKALQLPDSLTKTTDEIASYIKTNFSNDKEKARAIFTCTATNIQYDIENMFAINFYEKKEDKIAKALHTRKGICENYAAVFQDACTKAGIKSYVIEGYTKQNGFTDYIPHAWCAALIDTTWYMFDPTWGSGYVNGGKFYRKINNDYFMARPSTLIKSHMPFDFMWQFLNYPVTNQEFYEGKTQQDKTKPFFNYNDSIKAYENLSHTEQLISAAVRIEKNGIKNSMIFDRLHHIKQEIEQERQEKAFNLYNGAVTNYNDAVNAFNEFVNYRNKQFTPLKSDGEIQNMIDLPDKKLKEAKAKMKEIKEPDSNLAPIMPQLTRSIDDITRQVNEQQEWLKTYFSKGKSGRKSMFYETKMTWFGIPLGK
jgi:transglutaminase/protease-like cytokinesis protein 3